MRRFDSCCSCLLRLSFTQTEKFRRPFRKRKQKFKIPYKQILRRSFKKVMIKAIPKVTHPLVRLHNFRIKKKLFSKRHKFTPTSTKYFFNKLPKPVSNTLLFQWSEAQITALPTITLPAVLLTTSYIPLNLLAQSSTKTPKSLYSYFQSQTLHYRSSRFPSKVFFNEPYFVQKFLQPKFWKTSKNWTTSHKLLISDNIEDFTEINSKKQLSAFQTLYYLEFFNKTLTPLSSLFRHSYRNLITYAVPKPKHFSSYYYRIDRREKPTDSQVSMFSKRNSNFLLQFPTLTLTTLLLNEWLNIRKPVFSQNFVPITISRRVRRRVRRRYWREWVRMEALKWKDLTTSSLFALNTARPQLSPNVTKSLPYYLKVDSLIANLHLWLYLKEAPILLKYILGGLSAEVLTQSGLFLKVLARSKRGDNFTSPLLSNFVPALAIKFTIYRRILRVVGFSKFIPNVVPYYQYTLIQFLESMTGKRVYLKFNPFIENSLTFLDLSRCVVWEQRVMGFKRILGPKIFLNESLRIIYLSIKTKDSTFLTNWIKAMLYRMSFWKYRVIFRYLKYVIKVLFRPYFEELDFKGLKIKLKGKISIAGNGRTRTLMYRIGQTSNATFDNRVNYTLTLVHTFTGVLGFQLWLYY